MDFVRMHLLPPAQGNIIGTQFQEVEGGLLHKGGCLQILGKYFSFFNNT